jgi:23S rRNA pseudouridine2605 synthase
MAKFEKRDRSGGQSDGKAGKKGYKAKRSFTRNKAIRKRSPADKDEKAGDRSFREKRTFDRPWKKEGGKETRRDERKSFRDEGDNNRSERKFSERPERKNEYSDRKKDNRSSEKPEGKEGYADRKKDHKFSGRQVRKEGPEDRKRDDRFPGRSQRNEGFSGRKKENNFSENSPRKDGHSEREREDKPRFEKDKRDRSSFKPDDRSRRRKPAETGHGQDERSTRRVKFDEFERGNAFEKQGYEGRKGSSPKKSSDDGLTRLNKYLANAGIASRREADNLIQSGAVKVNGVVVDQLGYKIKPGDKVSYGDSAVKTERKVYLLLNKPKDYITTVDDPRDRKTVMELIEGACRERVYPVGRLDRNTTGLLLLTNDGDLTKKLTHPKFGVKKVYHVSLNKGLRAEDFKSIVEGVELEDGMIKADDLAFVGEGKKEVGIEIHSGRNRVVRRLFEHLGYDVLKLDRVVFAGLTKKDLPRGKHRFLTAKEIGFLQMIG